VSGNLPWGVVRALCVTQVLGWGALYYAIAVLAPAIADDTGWRRDTVVLGYTLALFAQAGSALAVGLALDRFGARRVMALGSALAAVSFVIIGASDTLPLFYAGWVLAGVAMAAILYEPAFAAITVAFGPAARRGITVLTLAGGLAGTVSFPATLFLVERFGWRGACFGWAAAQAAICLPLHLAFLPDAAARAVKATATLGRAIASPAFWFAATGLALNGLIFTAMGVHAIPMFQEAGFSAQLAVTLAAAIGVMQVAARLLEFGPMGRARAVHVAVVVASALPVAFVLLIAAPVSKWLAVGFVVLYGAANGVMTIVRGALPADLFGRVGYGGVAGAMTTPAMLARAIAPWAAAAAWAVFGGYGPVLWMLVAIAVASALAFLVAARVAPRDP
jgi:predicted MFS family arabinose efflux permease